MILKNKKYLSIIWNTTIWIITNSFLSLLIVMPELCILVVICGFMTKPVMIIISIGIVLTKTFLVNREKMYVKRINDYFIAINIKWLNTWVLFQKVNKKAIKNKSCSVKYEELRNIPESFNISLLHSKNNYITITHKVVIEGLEKIQGVYIERKIYMYSKSLKTLQKQIFMCKKASDKCEIRIKGRIPRKFYFIKFKYYGEGVE